MIAERLNYEQPSSADFRRQNPILEPRTNHNDSGGVCRTRRGRFFL